MAALPAVPAVHLIDLRAAHQPVVKIASCASECIGRGTAEIGRRRKLAGRPQPLKFFPVDHDTAETVKNDFSKNTFAIAGYGHDFAEIDRVVRNTHKILLLC